MRKPTPFMYMCRVCMRTSCMSAPTGTHEAPPPLGIHLVRGTCCSPPFLSWVWVSALLFVWGPFPLLLTSIFSSYMLTYLPFACIKPKTAHRCGFLNLVHVFSRSINKGWLLFRCKQNFVELGGGVRGIESLAGDGNVRGRKYSIRAVYCTWPHGMRGRLMWGTRWMIAKGQESLCNLRSVADIGLIWLCVALTVVCKTPLVERLTCFFRNVPWIQQKIYRSQLDSIGRWRQADGGMQTAVC